MTDGRDPEALSADNSRQRQAHVTRARASQRTAFLGHSDWLWKSPVIQSCPIRVKLKTVAGTSQKWLPFPTKLFVGVRGVWGQQQPLVPQRTESHWRGKLDERGSRGTTAPLNYLPNPTSPQMPFFTVLTTFGVVRCS